MTKEDPIFLEEEFHRKENKDRRSKTKKKFATKLKDAQLLKGRILSVTGETATVSYDEKEYQCTLKGLLKKDKTQQKNIIAVGDFVLFSFENEEEGSIHSVEPRFSFLTRQDPFKQKEHLLAVNIDQVFITCSIIQPTLKPTLIDRYLIAAHKGNMNPIILINKIDLLDDETIDLKVREKEKELYLLALEAYEKAGIPILSISTVDNRGVESLKALMNNKASVFSGQSGVGKSSLINLICNTDFLVKKMVARTKKGSHSTTKAILIPLESGGFCIDTPGIKSFGVWDLKKEDIVSHFSEIQEIGKNCKYPNCLHLVEPECAVREAFNEKKISPLRFESYSSLIGSLGKEDKKR